MKNCYGLGSREGVHLKSYQLADSPSAGVPQIGFRSSPCTRSCSRTRSWSRTRKIIKFCSEMSSYAPKSVHVKTGERRMHRDHFLTRPDPKRPLARSQNIKKSGSPEFLGVPVFWVCLPQLVGLFKCIFSHAFQAVVISTPMLLP